MLLEYLGQARRTLEEPVRITAGSGTRLEGPQPCPVSGERAKVQGGNFGETDGSRKKSLPEREAMAGAPREEAQSALAPSVYD